MFFFSLNICQWHCPFVEGCYECEMPPTWRIQMTFVWKAPVQTISLRLRIFSMFQKKNITKNFMFKMCFRPHRTQKIYSPKKQNFFPLKGIGLSFFLDVPRRVRRPWESSGDVRLGSADLAMFAQTFKGFIKIGEIWKFNTVCIETSSTNKFK